MALKETVERLRSAQGEPDDPARTVARWQSAVSRLYDDIDQWLKPFVEDGGIVLKRQVKSTNEEHTGPYEIDRLDIDVGEETVRLDPRATIVIGARGRVDMSHLGSGEPLFLVLLGTEDEPRWVLVDPSVRAKVTPLTSEAFEGALEKMLEAYGAHTGPSV